MRLQSIKVLHEHKHTHTGITYSILHTVSRAQNQSLELWDSNAPLTLFLFPTSFIPSWETHRILIRMHGKRKLLEGLTNLPGAGFSWNTQQLIVILVWANCHHEPRQDEEEQHRSHGKCPTILEDQWRWWSLASHCCRESQAFWTRLELKYGCHLQWRILYAQRWCKCYRSISFLMSSHVRLRQTCLHKVEYFKLW